MDKAQLNSVRQSGVGGYCVSIFHDDDDEACFTLPKRQRLFVFDQGDLM